MSTVSLSLFLFNLLPLPYTDGSQLLKALLSLQSKPKSNKTISLRSPPQIRPLTARATRSSKATTPTINIRFNPIASKATSARGYDRDDDEEGYEMDDTRDVMGRREEVWKRRLRRGIESGVMGMAGGWVLGWAMLALLRSS